MGTVERPEGANGEVPRPLRSFVSSWETSPDRIGGPNDGEGMFLLNY